MGLVRAVLRDGARRNSILVHRAPRTPRGTGGALGIEEILAGLAFLNHTAPDLEFLELAEAAIIAGILDLLAGMLLTQPAREIAHPRRGPDLLTGIAMAAIDGVDQRISELLVRRKHGLARIERRRQRGRNALRAQSSRTLPVEPTMCSAGAPAVCPSKSSKREIRLERTWGASRLVVRKQVGYGTLKQTPGATSTCLPSSKSSEKT